MTALYDTLNPWVSPWAHVGAFGLMIMHTGRNGFPDWPVLITDYGSSEMTPEWWAEQGAAAYLENPIDAPRLLETVRRVLGQPAETTGAW